ncbi:MAG TPA: cupredoxin family copper-binding protein [Methylomirabilota bacterium]|jgi:plastocyanin|nr:cupredoxin family copper-binding protein [Methylomirabilota bacterium]
MKRVTLTLAALAGVLAAASHVPAARPARVDIKDFKYGPPQIVVPAGEKVTWTNHDEETHTITSATGAFSSTGLGHDETFTQTFTKPGTYAYFCALHPQMRATVVVR